MRNVKHYLKIAAIGTALAFAALPDAVSGQAVDRADGAATPVTHYRTAKIDGLDIFYREAGPADGLSFSSFTAFRRRRTCSAI